MWFIRIDGKDSRGQKKRGVVVTFQIREVGEKHVGHTMRPLIALLGWGGWDGGRGGGRGGGGGRCLFLGSDMEYIGGESSIIV